MDSLVSTQWLADEMGASDLRIVDATAFLPEHGRVPLLEYEACHIPGAVFMDLSELVDSASPVPNTLPSPEKFASRMQALGLGDGSRIVIYDDSPVKTSTRAWFMLTMFGAQNVALLDGGIAKWKAEGRKCAQGTETLRQRHFTVWSDDSHVRSKADVLANLQSNAEQVVDARGPGRFTGDMPEANPALASGHIPGARNVPYASLFNPDGTWKAPDAIKALFEAAGVDLARPLITSCGSGMTANVLIFAAHLIGKEDVSLYDGSWSEWGLDPATPKATGVA
ncbi:MAG: 3-mercaptopyruvate sulfurtransferase [Novosphingobium sp. 28-62-57]|nr:MULTISPECIES: 3-mercaptopyruvate sulfurtransferase [unclassified Novosphingobium]OYW49025.1 MAG: 3-mercaptopyruvate sulfurtransferase [Novosphingobium sp. 12-62-10]OYZ09507.1 MAG: 3-mercaptopyruvate sulfurtransferase [Novosphingobium sp. 28-62-57]OZA30498.1 MAG: 3-mercaptopyruvate sulfurtransferase [Novosphingobium sp. 17-62-9]